MTSILQRLLPLSRPPEPVRPGVYHYQAGADAAVPYRLHLRIEPDGTGILMVNAATVLHLNVTATIHALELVRGVSDEEAAREVRQRFRVSRSQALADQRRLRDQVMRLAVQPDLDPVVFLDMERREPYSTALSAPYRLDLALTYMTDPRGTQDPLARKRVDRELKTAEWKQILTKAWEAGIPHVTFTGGEPTRRKDLPTLIGYTQEIGQVSGLLTEGRRLADKRYVSQLSKAGLDHILISLVPGNAASMAGLKNAIASDVFTAVHLTLTDAGVRQVTSRLQELKSLGVLAVSLSASSSSKKMKEALAKARGEAARLGMDLIWDLPVPYSASHPLRLELETSVDGAGRAWLYVEPDGDVLPAQGVDRILGNMLRDPWADIWARARA